MTQLEPVQREDLAKTQDAVDFRVCVSVPLKVFAHLGLGAFLGFLGSPILDQIISPEPVISQPSQPPLEEVCPANEGKEVGTP